MVKILYGLSSVGMGHAVRSKSIIRHLEKKGHEVLVLSSKDTFEYLSKYFKKVYNIEGFELVYKNNRVVSLRTFFKNVCKFNPGTYSKLVDIMKIIKEFNPSMAISDWESFSSYMARNLKIPLLSLDNQAYLKWGSYRVPFKYLLQYWKARIILRSLVRKPDYSIVMLFPETKIKKRKKIFAASPLIRKEIKKAKIKNGKHIVVYDTTRKHDQLIDLLKEVNEKFIVYGLDRVSKEENIEFKRFDDSTFVKDLSSCKALITSAGFTLLTEAMHLEKPIFCIPIKKHFEQILNGLYVEEKGFGVMELDPCSSDIRKFLDKTYRKVKIKDNLFKVLDKVIEKIIK